MSRLPLAVILALAAGNPLLDGCHTNPQAPPYTDSTLITPPVTPPGKPPLSPNAARSSITAIEAGAVVLAPVLAIPVAIVWGIREAARAGIFGPTAAAAAHNATYSRTVTPAQAIDLSPAHNDPPAPSR